MTVLLVRNHAKHTLLGDHFLAIRRRRRLALFRRDIGDLWLIRATGADCAAYMRHAPDALLVARFDPQPASPTFTVCCPSSISPRASIAHCSAVPCGICCRRRVLAKPTSLQSADWYEKLARRRVDRTGQPVNLGGHRAATRGPVSYIRCGQPAQTIARVLVGSVSRVLVLSRRSGQLAACTFIRPAARTGLTANRHLSESRRLPVAPPFRRMDFATGRLRYRH